MQKLFGLRILREIKCNSFRYGALGFLIFLGMYLVVSMVGAAETVITRVEENAVTYHQEDGEFQVFAPLSKEQEEKIEEQNLVLENMFSFHFSLEDNSVMRVFQNREYINKIALEEGVLATNMKEGVVEKRYAKEHHLAIGDKISVAGETLTITGIGCVPDYDGLFQEFSDSSADSRQFGLLFVTKEQYQSFKETEKEISMEDYTYGYQWKEGWKSEEAEEELKEILRGFTAENVPMLTQFVTASDNPRIKASAKDQTITKYAGILVGVIVMILFTYVISVFVIHGIEKEAGVIGTFYALGVKRRELLFHYLVLPVVITFLSGVLGTLAGFSRYGITLQIQSCYNYFSVPSFKTVYSPYLIAYGMVMPPLIGAIVNCTVIWRKLSVPTLKLIKNEQIQGKNSKVQLKNVGFINAFGIRQMLREKRSIFTVIFGMLISLMLLIMGLNCYIMCENIGTQSEEDTRFKYMYTYKYPDDKPEKGEISFARKMSKEMFGESMEVTLLGIEKKNPYFDANVKPGKNKIVASSSAAQKFGLETGDQIVLSDKAEGVDYGFRVTGITPYSVGLYVFMDISDMREMFGKEEGYYNVVFSDEKLEIDSEKLYAVTSKEEIVKGAEVFRELLRPLVTMLCSVSVLVFFMVMYLMIKVMLERAVMGISLMKIFGYRNGEIRKIYMDCNFYVIAIGGIFCIPVAKKVVDNMYPLILSNVSIGVDMRFSFRMYLLIYVGMMVVYLAVNCLLMKRIRKIGAGEVLKNRE